MCLGVLPIDGSDMEFSVDETTEPATQPLVASHTQVANLARVCELRGKVKSDDGRPTYRSFNVGA